jgi:hypothetical protein
MQRFNYADFSANPGKYRQFSTARLAGNLFTEGGANDGKAGTVVSLQYLNTVRNQMFRREEPIYLASANGQEWAVYASALADFCL